MNEVAFRAAELALWQSHGLTPREHMLVVDGKRLRVQDVGVENDNPPIVFVHGSPNTGSIYAPLAARLAADFRCVLVDRPGTGLSERRDGTSDANPQATVLRVLDEVLAALSIPRAHFVGSSLGGWWSLVYALARPDRVVRMVQHGCPAGLPGERLPFGVRMIKIPGMATMMTAMKPSPSSVRMAFSFIGHKQSLSTGTIDPAVLDWYLSVLRDTDTQKNDIAADAKVIRLFDPVMRELALDETALRGLQAPTAILWGTHDSFGGVDVARQTRALLPGPPDALEIIEGGGHLPWLDDVARAAAQARAFFA